MLCSSVSFGMRSRFCLNNTWTLFYYKLLFVILGIFRPELWVMAFLSVASPFLTKKTGKIRTAVCFLFIKCTFIKTFWKLDGGSLSTQVTNLKVLIENMRDHGLSCIVPEFHVAPVYCFPSCADEKGLFVSDGRLESVVILGLKKVTRQPTLKSGNNYIYSKMLLCVLFVFPINKTYVIMFDDNIKL